MSLSVSAINRNFSYARTNSIKSNNNTQNNTVNNQMQNEVNFGAKKNGMRMLVPAAFALPVAGALSGCYAKAEAYAYSEDTCCGGKQPQVIVVKDTNKCCPHPMNDKDTFWIRDSFPVYIYRTDTLRDSVIVRDTINNEVPVPYPVIEWRVDSVPVIIERHDTAYIKEKYKSPVIDSLNNIIDDLGGDPNRGYIPLRISFIDEMDTKYRRFIFDGKSSSRDQVYYDSKKSPWSDDEATFIIDTPLDEKEKYILSLTEDGKIYAMKMIPKNGVTDPKGMDDYMLAPTSFVFDRDRAEKLIRKFNVARDQVGREYYGTLEKDAKPKSIMITNPYDAKWRWTNVNITSADSPDEVE